MWSWRFPPRGRALDALVGNLQLSLNVSDKWSWSGNASRFSKVKLLAKSIQEHTLSDSNLGEHHQWNSWIQQEVNICAWRASLNGLPARLNLSLRGVNIASLCCPFCASDTEEIDHCFIKCPRVVVVWRKVWRWWHLIWL
ncbi:RNA-directed DNA polymerase, eukaryota, reverse transcriptase zinc-binding domain protein [Tanacetum coccineum]|uniref:RNA-directed DNA polymerase, eukaryota, reverse transcriptase zinc-binding domain protein n=1 Tax=Tanacetum coccineum TaxID=301880 RepID=A0ABQ5E9P0_9ASTR